MYFDVNCQVMEPWDLYNFAQVGIWDGYGAPITMVMLCIQNDSWAAASRVPFWTHKRLVSLMARTPSNHPKQGWLEPYWRVGDWWQDQIGGSMRKSHSWAKHTFLFNISLIELLECLSDSVRRIALLATGYHDFMIWHDMIPFEWLDRA